ncbi:unnamed protein product [Amoebophrya sp. A25]|nr:unnamed protein product [Amoebophrya sp. A25]|eukprot:GSA25T00008222001.1
MKVQLFANFGAFCLRLSLNLMMKKASPRKTFLRREVRSSS